MMRELMEPVDWAVRDEVEGRWAGRAMLFGSMAGLAVWVLLLAAAVICL